MYIGIIMTSERNPLADLGIDQQQFIVMEQWVKKLIATFPTADIQYKNDKEYIIKIRVDDIFKLYYNTLKQTIKGSIKLAPCEFSQLGWCIGINTVQLVVGWENYRMKPIEIVDRDYVRHYIVPVEQMLTHFDEQWVNVNKGKPIQLKFSTRKTVEPTSYGIPWHYIHVINEGVVNERR